MTIHDRRIPLPPKEWTVLAYMNGANDLEPEIVKNVIDMETVGSTPSVNVVAQLSRAPQSMAHKKKDAPPDDLDGDWSGTRRYLITQAPHPDRARRRITSSVLERLPATTDMGAPATFADFLKWGMKNYPARHYLVVVNNHGAGFRGVSFDDVHDSRLSMEEVKKGLQDAEKAAGARPEVVLFDACEMEQAEVAYQLKDATHYMLGSEEQIGADGLPYDKILGELTKDPTMTPRQLSRTVVDIAGQAEAARRGYLEDDKREDILQFSAVDLKEMQGLRDRTDALARTLEKEVPRDTVAGIVKQTKRFSRGGHEAPDRDFRDLGDFAERLMRSPSIDSDKVKQAAHDVLLALSQAVIAQEKEGQGMARSHGLSIYLPTDLGSDRPAKRNLTQEEKDPVDPTWGYGDLDMSKDGEWGGFLSWLSSGSSPV